MDRIRCSCPWSKRAKACSQLVLISVDLLTCSCPRERHPVRITFRCPTRRMWAPKLGEWNLDRWCIVYTSLKYFAPSLCSMHAVIEGCSRLCMNHTYVSLLRRPHTTKDAGRAAGGLPGAVIDGCGVVSCHNNKVIARGNYKDSSPASVVSDPQVYIDKRSAPRKIVFPIHFQLFIMSEQLRSSASTVTQVDATVEPKHTSATEKMSTPSGPKKRLFRPYVTPFDRVMSHKYPGSGTASDPYIVDWLPDDPEDPQRWPGVFKWWTIAIASFSTLAVALSSSAYSGGIESLIKDFGVSSELLVAGISLFVVVSNASFCNLITKRS